jgi:hypothetical protein
MILSRVPNSILRSKFVPAVQVLGTVVLQSSSSSPLPDGGTTATGGSSKCLRSATSCLCQVLAASDPQDWMPAVPAFNMVLNLSLDKRPKVRRRAQAGIEEVLASLQQQGGGGGPSSTSAALTQASQSIFKMCEKILPSPEAAARAAAAAASSKKRQQAEDAIAAAVSDALHLLGLLKKIISLLSGKYKNKNKNKQGGGYIVDSALHMYMINDENQGLICYRQRDLNKSMKIEATSICLDFRGHHIYSTSTPLSLYIQDMILTLSPFSLPSPFSSLFLQ